MHVEEFRRVNGKLQRRRVEKPWKEGGRSSREEGAGDGGGVLKCKWLGRGACAVKWLTGAMAGKPRRCKKRSK